MRPKSITLVTANSPVVVPVDYRARSTSIQAEVTGTVDYTAAYTLENIYGITTPATNANWVDVTGMAAVTADAQKLIDGSIFALRYTLNSGAGSVKITVSQPDAF
jgi:hypothetical protein